MISDKRLYLTASGEVVEDGHPDAARLLVGEGCTIADHLAVKYGLMAPKDATAAAPPSRPNDIREVYVIVGAGVAAGQIRLGGAFTTAALAEQHVRPGLDQGVCLPINRPLPDGSTFGECLVELPPDPAWPDAAALQAAIDTLTAESQAAAERYRQKLADLDSTIENLTREIEEINAAAQLSAETTDTIVAKLRDAAAQRAISVPDGAGLLQVAELLAAPQPAAREAAMTEQKPAEKPAEPQEKAVQAAPENKAVQKPAETK